MLSRDHEQRTPKILILSRDDLSFTCDIPETKLPRFPISVDPEDPEGPSPLTNRNPEQELMQLPTKSDEFACYWHTNKTQVIRKGLVIPVAARRRCRLVKWHLAICKKCWHTSGWDSLPKPTFQNFASPRPCKALIVHLAKTTPALSRSSLVLRRAPLFQSVHLSMVQGEKDTFCNRRRLYPLVLQDGNNTYQL